MFRHYLFVAIRNIRKNLGFSFINFMGLSIGLAISLIVMLHVQFEWSFDNFHQNADRIFRLKRFEQMDSGMSQSFVTPFLLKDVVQQELPLVEKSTRLMHSYRSVRLPDKSEYMQFISFVSTDFLEIFNFRIIEGNHKLGKYDVILTQEAVKRYFGEEPAIGKTIEMKLSDDFMPLTVAGIIEDIPANSSIVVEALLSDELVPDTQSLASLNNWYNVITDTYVMTKSAEDKVALASGMETMMQNALGDKYQAGAYYFEPVTLRNIHFYTGENPGNISITNPVMLYVLLALGLAVLVLGSINYVTMAIGKSAVRAKEVGVRKALGAAKKQLAFQFLFESIVITFLSFVFAVVLTLMLLPNFNILFNTNLEILFTLKQLSLMGGLLLFLTLLAGGFPAFYLSAMETVQVLKGTFMMSFGKQELRKGMVGLQFFLSFLMISCTLVMYHQLEMLKSHDLGFQPDQVYVIPVNSESSGKFIARLKNSFDKANLFRERLMARTEVENAALSVSLFGNEDWWNAGFTNTDGRQFSFQLNFVVGDYLGTMGIKIAEGRNFYEDLTLDSGAVMVNRRFAQQIGWKSIVDAQLPASANFSSHEVVAILEDFHHTSLYDEISPVLLSKNPKLILEGINDISINRSNAVVLVKSKQQNAEKFQELLKDEFQQVYPGEEFSIYPFNEFVFAAYQNEERLSRMVTYTALVAVFIAVMGLVAFTAMTIAGRVKEIGIRKVLGASPVTIAWMFNKEFIGVTLTGIFFAIPSGIWLMQNWMQQFAFKDWPGAGTFVLAIIFGLGLTALLVSLQSLSAALVNPVKTLKSE